MRRRNLPAAAAVIQFVIHGSTPHLKSVRIGRRAGARIPRRRRRRRGQRRRQQRVAAQRARILHAVPNIAIRRSAGVAGAAAGTVAEEPEQLVVVEQLLGRRPKSQLIANLVGALLDAPRQAFAKSAFLDLADHVQRQEVRVVGRRIEGRVRRVDGVLEIPPERRVPVKFKMIELESCGVSDTL